MVLHEVLHSPNLTLSNPDLTHKAKGGQQGGSRPVSSQAQTIQLSDLATPTLPPTVRISSRGELGQRQGTDVGLCSGSGQKAASRCFSLLSTSCQFPTLAKLQRALFEIRSTRHMHS